ncbi:MAG: dipeptidase [Anaerolineae bacterium]|jgi:acetylornithine deacetylase/succinyl-diaminopimelate desuccinylase-like protein
MIDAALAYARDRRRQYLAALVELLRIPSVSMEPEHGADMARAAGWLAGYLERMGMTRVEMLPTQGFPVVYGEWLGAGEDAPTLLAYGHYDVQPVDPVEEWLTPPFEPTIRGDDIFCRGASDDKGQLFAVLAAVEAYLGAAGRLPVNVKIMLEGEEELSSPHMAAFIERHHQQLAADAVLICDEAVLDPQTPLVMYGVRGTLYLEIDVRGPAQDLHSGTFGGAVDNPFNVLVRLLAGLQDGESRRIQIPGFYERVRPLDDAERALLARVPVDDQAARHLAGVGVLAGEDGYTTVERVSVRPTLEIHGMPGGFTGPGNKTVIPARASAKVSMRLVPDQNPQEIRHLFKEYLRAMAPPTVDLTIRTLGASRPVVMDYRAVEIQAIARALEQGFGAPPVYFRGGGSLPIVADFQERFGVPVVLIGFGMPDDNIHAPNEKYHLPNFYRGIETVIHYISILSEMQRD